MIFYNSKNSIRDMRPFFRLLFCLSSFVKYTLCLLQWWTHNETWLPNITEIPPLLTLLARSALRHAIAVDKQTIYWNSQLMQPLSA